MSALFEKTKYVCELPISRHDWYLKSVKREDGSIVIIAINQDFPVLIIENNIATELVLK